LVADLLVIGGRVHGAVVSSAAAQCCGVCAYLCHISQARCSVNLQRSARVLTAMGRVTSGTSQAPDLSSASTVSWIASAGSIAATCAGNVGRVLLCVFMCCCSVG
jgi:hypothetical protein